MTKESSIIAAPNGGVAVTGQVIATKTPVADAHADTIDEGKVLDELLTELNAAQKSGWDGW